MKLLLLFSSSIILVALQHTAKTDSVTKKIKYMKLLSSRMLIVVSIALFVFSCQKPIDIFHPGNGKDNDKSNTYSSSQVKMGAGKARSWITIDKKGVPKEIGVEMTDDVLYGLADTNFNVTIPFHAKAKEITPFDHLYITWASHGHPLPGTFIGPHFDVRFFMTSLAEHLAIPAYAAAPAGFDNHPPTGYMPANYFPDAPIPQLGLHWTDKTFSNPVTSAMILGSYDGRFTFISPIMVLDVLQSGQNFSASYAQPQYFAETNKYYPTRYNIYKDDATQKHYITLSDFVLR